MPLRFSRIRLLPLAAAFALALAGGACRTYVADDEAEDPGLIVLGVSVSNVYYGDDSLQVVRVLGEPTRVRGALYAGNTPVRAFEYRTGAYAGLSVSVLPGYGVVEFRMFPPYALRTAEGIGIGSLRADIIAALGQPNQRLTNPLRDIYYHATGRITMQFRDARLDTLSVTGAKLSTK